jgi:hypothetical protein
LEKWQTQETLAELVAEEMTLIILVLGVLELVVWMKVKAIVGL